MPPTTAPYYSQPPAQNGGYPEPDTHVFALAGHALQEHRSASQLAGLIAAATVERNHPAAISSSESLRQGPSGRVADVDGSGPRKRKRGEGYDGDDDDDDDDAAGQQQEQQQQQQTPQSASALFRRPSASSKKYTRPPMSKLFTSLELSPESFLQLQAAAKAYMLDEAHADRKETIGQRGKGDSELVKLRLWTCVRDFLEAEGNGGRFFGRAVEGDDGVARTMFWPDDRNRIIGAVTPLLRRMVTNERQRRYAVETRKGAGTGDTPAKKRKPRAGRAYDEDEGSADDRNHGLFVAQSAAAAVAAAAATTALDRADEPGDDGGSSSSSSSSSGGDGETPSRRALNPSATATATAAVGSPRPTPSPGQQPATNNNNNNNKDASASANADLTLRLNVIHNGIRIGPHHAVPAASCPRLHTVVQRALDHRRGQQQQQQQQQHDKGALDTGQQQQRQQRAVVSILLPQGLHDVGDDDEWRAATELVAATEWMDGEAVVLVRFGRRV